MTGEHWDEDVTDARGAIRLSHPESEHTPGKGEEQVSVTMTVAAAERFSKALGYADAVLAGHADVNPARATQEAMEHGDWLRWGMGRIAQADPRGEQSR